MTADDEVTITVRRHDLTLLLEQADQSWLSVERIQAAIPPPEWEPSDEQIAASHTVWPHRTHAIAGLKNLHAAGLVLP